MSAGVFRPGFGVLLDSCYCSHSLKCACQRHSHNHMNGLCTRRCVPPLGGRSACLQPSGRQSSHAGGRSADGFNRLRPRQRGERTVSPGVSRTYGVHLSHGSSFAKDGLSGPPSQPAPPGRGARSPKDEVFLNIEHASQVGAAEIISKM